MSAGPYCPDCGLNAGVHTNDCMDGWTKHPLEPGFYWFYGRLEGFPEAPSFYLAKVFPNAQRIRIVGRVFAHDLNFQGLFKRAEMPEPPEED